MAGSVEKKEVQKECAHISLFSPCAVSLAVCGKISFSKIPFSPLIGLEAL